MNRRDLIRRGLSVLALAGFKPAIIAAGGTGPQKAIAHRHIPSLHPFTGKITCVVCCSEMPAPDPDCAHQTQRAYDSTRCLYVCRCGLRLPAQYGERVITKAEARDEWYARMIRSGQLPIGRFPIR